MSSLASNFLLWQTGRVRRILPRGLRICWHWAVFGTSEATLSTVISPFGDKASQRRQQGLEAYFEFVAVLGAEPSL